MALRLHHVLGGPHLPDGAVAQEDVGQRPRPAHQQAGPPAVRAQQGGLGGAAGQLGEAAPDVGHRRREGRRRDAEVEVAGRGQLVGQVRALQVGEAGREDAGGEQAVVQPGGRAGAEVGAERVVQGADRVDRDERQARGGQRQRQRAVALDRAHQHAHGERQPGGQRASEQEQGEPRGRQPGRGAAQHAEEPPLGRAGETLQEALRAVHDGADPSARRETLSWTDVSGSPAKIVRRSRRT